MSAKRLMRKRDDRMFFGVASGIASYLNLDPVIIRLLFVLMALTGGHGVLVYLILAILLPEEDAVIAKANTFDEEEIVIKDMP
jgi:phage shock protein PspC (stress-responsive transcriptional regulator)